ncbi:MAG: hypothetical protein JWO44_716 [Bacteroidetes bacterium]|nr:hypothetical protein [Bacteroidota bacterium]
MTSEIAVPAAIAGRLKVNTPEPEAVVKLAEPPPVQVKWKVNGLHAVVFTVSVFWQACIDPVFKVLGGLESWISGQRNFNVFLSGVKENRMASNVTDIKILVVFMAFGFNWFIYQTS